MAIFAFRRKAKMYLFSKLTKFLPRHNAFWPTAVVGEAGSVIYASASAYYSSGPKGVGPGQNALLHAKFILFQVFIIFFIFLILD